MSLTSLAERHRKGREAPVRSPGAGLAEAASFGPRAIQRLPTAYPPLAAATGGGFVRGAVYLLHGEPGSGKSTLIGAGAGLIPRSVYVSAEEADSMVAARFQRLGYPRQLIAEENKTERALRLIGSAPFAVIDSISAMRPKGLPSAELIVEHARRYNVAVCLICHETKGGQHAGPRELEHLIDCTLKLYRQPRVLVVEKNRFGPAPLAWQLQLGESGFL